MEGPIFFLSPRATQVGPEALCGFTHVGYLLDSSESSTEPAGPVLLRSSITPHSRIMGVTQLSTLAHFIAQKQVTGSTYLQGRGVTQERDSFGGHPPDGNCSCLGDLEKGSVRESNSPQGHWRETSARAWMRRIQSSKSVRHLPPKGAEVGFPLKYPCLKRVMEPTACAGHRM